MKTVFITITRGLLTRNILRNQFFDKLKERNDIRIVLMFSDYVRNNGEYLKKEFESRNIIVEFVPNVVESKLKKLFMAISKNLVFSTTTKLYAKYGTSKVPRKSKVINLLLNIIYTPLSKINFLKKIVRLIEVYVFRDSNYGKYFDIYKPQLVFSTALLSNFDLAFLKNAKRRGVKTISMPKSWDNLSKILFRFEPDMFCVQNELMKRDAVEHQGFKSSKIKTVGFLQFDVYKDATGIESRSRYCERHGFNPELPIIFMGSEGLWSDGDEKVFENVIRSRESGVIPDVNFIIRPHFSLAYDGRYDHLKKFKRVFIDNTYRITEFFADHWDPTQEDMKDFTNTLRHSDVTINFASTLSLDAVSLDRPVINISFGIRFDEGKDISHIIYETGFYREVIQTGATELVYNPEELNKAIHAYLKNSSFKKEGREKLRNKLCYSLDGKSGLRLYGVVEGYLR